MHCTGYEEDDFTRRLDTELFPQLDGTPMQEPGGYTNQSILEAWRKRVPEHRPWGECGHDGGRRTRPCHRCPLCPAAEKNGGGRV